MHDLKSSVLLSLSIFSSAAFAEWQFIGPFGGSADIIRVARSNPRVLVAAARNALIYRSADAGATWNRIAFAAEHGSILHALEIDPSDEGRWYAGVEDESEGLSGIYLTTDSGQTWSRIRGIERKKIWSIAIWQRDPRVVVAGAADGVYRSSDRGETWVRISPEVNKALQPVVSLALEPENPAVIYAGTTHLAWRTMDGGQTWRSIHTGMLDDSDVFSIVIHPQRPTVIYASACSGAYRSADSASLWSRLATPRGTFRTYVVAVDPNTPNVVYAGTSSGLLQSSDEGKTWKKISPHAVKSIDFVGDKSGRAYFASTTGGILTRSGVDAAVNESNLGFANRTWVALAGTKGFLFANSVYDVTGGLFRSDDAGGAWRRVSGAEATRGDSLLFLAPSPHAALTLFGATRSAVWRSTDGGKAWVALTNMPAGQVLALSFTADAGGGLYLATSSGLHKSQDEGKTWNQISLPSNAPLRSVQLSGGALFAVTASTTAFSRDSGNTWTACGPPSTPVDWYGVAAKADSPFVLAATSHGLLRSSDGCKTWSFVRSGVEASTVMNVLVHPSRPEFFAVQRGRLLRSADDGETWQSLSGISASETTPIALGILPDNPDNVFALFRRRGVARWNLRASGQEGAGVLKPTTQ
jgi:photosystem II stability/assembly factor-like uncharacterized protein